MEVSLYVYNNYVHTHTSWSTESGRSFEVSAAVRKNASRGNRSKSRLHRVVSQVLPDLPTLQVPL